MSGPSDEVYRLATELNARLRVLSEPLLIEISKKLSDAIGSRVDVVLVTKVRIPGVDATAAAIGSTLNTPAQVADTLVSAAQVYGEAVLSGAQKGDLVKGVHAHSDSETGKVRILPPKSDPRFPH